MRNPRARRNVAKGAAGREPGRRRGRRGRKKPTVVVPELMYPELELCPPRELPPFTL